MNGMNKNRFKVGDIVYSIYFPDVLLKIVSVNTDGTYDWVYPEVPEKVFWSGWSAFDAKFKTYKKK